MQMALDFCEFLWREVAMNDYAEEKREATEAALRAALAEQNDDLTAAWMAGAAEERKRAEQAQPVAECIDDICSEHSGRVEAFDHLPAGTKLYTTPPALAEQALDHMAENARELGLSYDATEQPQPEARDDQPECSDEDVICPACCSTFRAIPVAVQRLMLDAGFEPPFTAPPAPVAPQPLTIEEINALPEAQGWWPSDEVGRILRLIRAVEAEVIRRMGVQK